MRTALITGGSGFFGGLLKQDLLSRGWRVVNIDLESDEIDHPNLKSIRGDIRNSRTLEEICSAHDIDAVFHCAAILAHASADDSFLWSSNVDGTRNVAEACKRHRINKLIFTSSNCLWGENFGRPITEKDEPKPVEIYGRSKLAGEKILKEYEDCLKIITIRCPTIMDAGRLGLLSILFEFIDEGRKVWVVGGGKNRYQFIYAGDLIDACLKALDFNGSETFHIGSDDVKSFHDVYQYVIDKAGSGARVASIPKKPAIIFMKMAYALGLSPLGPYQYKMIAEDFEFDTSKIKEQLHWKPTVTNEEMLWKAYEYYHENRLEIEGRSGVSAHRSAAKMGIIRLLKWIS